MYFESKTLNVAIKRRKVHYIPDIVFAQVPTFSSSWQQLQMDILLPQSEKPLPAVIFVTGGGFISANRARCPQLRMRLAEAGYFVGSINYRTAPDSVFPQQVEDVRNAIGFLRASAKRFNIDAEKISVVGDSAGGYLAAFVSTINDPKICAGVSLYGVTDLTKIAADYDEERKALHKVSAAAESLLLFGVPQFRGRAGTVFTDEKLATNANPVNYVTEYSAPMLLMHGTADDVVSPSQTDLLFQALKNAGVDSERYVIPNANHSDEFWVQDEVFDVILNFLNKYSFDSK